MHHLLQKADDPQLQLHVELKVLRGDSTVFTEDGAGGSETTGTMRTCGCLDTQ